MASMRTFAVQAHSRRVAALAVEIACRAGARPADLPVVHHAACLHHHPSELMDERTVDCLLSGLLGPDWSGTNRLDPAFRRHTSDVLAVLRMFHSASLWDREERLALLADALTTANLFADELESPVSSENARERLVRNVSVRAENGLCRPAIARALVALPRMNESEMRAMLSRLPVFPVVVFQVLAMTADEDVTFRQLEKLLSSDQVLAGRLVAIANSCLYSPRAPIATIRQAISYIGLDATRRVAIAAVLQPLFASSNLRNLWQHSLEAARRCEYMAAAVGGIHPDEAFLAGLVHDVGRLAIWGMPAEAVTVYARLLEQGCEPVLAEMFLFGFDHGEMGAEILRLWNFPRHMVEAVGLHHQPERSASPLAGLLHLAEIEIAPAEAPPSTLRAQAARERAGACATPLAAEDREMELLAMVSAA